MAWEPGAGRKQSDAEKPSGDSRREALKKMVVGSSVAAGASMLPDKWVKPVMDKVLVPAHAQTSTTTTTEKPVAMEFRGQFSMEVGEKDIKRYSANSDVFDQITDINVPRAFAVRDLEITGDLCVKSLKDGTEFEAKLLVEVLVGDPPDPFFYAVSGGGVGAAVQFPQTAGCLNFQNEPLSITVESITTEEVKFDITGAVTASDILKPDPTCPSPPGSCPDSGS